MTCKKAHIHLSEIMNSIPTDQGGVGRHKCAACAYEIGYNAGYNLNGDLNIKSVLQNLEESQAGAQRHKSPHVAFALGYYKGVCQRTNDDN
ncbi:MAG: hypothetical protein HXN66_09950 [Prevotella pallens]|jgi:hypothetical protein|uniref:hypothetical protein n=1 Tax=Prevotella pallens TaxID=60133 RepID=UPI001CB3540E|nr:hypothetical protein [Prevotella pallens]MBF1471726.1 hypothetical protein [Prevotella pallens]